MRHNHDIGHTYKIFNKLCIIIILIIMLYFILRKCKKSVDKYRNLAITPPKRENLTGKVRKLCLFTHSEVIISLRKCKQSMHL